MNKLKISLVFLLFFKISAYSDDDVVQRANEKNASIITDYTNQHISVIADGRPNLDIEGSMANQYIFALTEARKNAYTRLATQLGRLYVDGNTILDDGRLMDNQFRLQLENLVQNAREIETKKIAESDGSFRVQSTVTLLLTGPNSLNSILVPKLQQAELEKLPSAKIPIENKLKQNDAEYTGLVIDARNLDAEPGLSPKIFAEDGRLVYSVVSCRKNSAIEHGVVQYAKKVDKLAMKEFMGDNPLVLMPLRITGQYKTDVVLSENDVEAVLSSTQRFDYLNEARVVFLID